MIIVCCTLPTTDMMIIVVLYTKIPNTVREHHPTSCLFAPCPSDIHTLVFVPFEFMCGVIYCVTFGPVPIVCHSDCPGGDGEAVEARTYVMWCTSNCYCVFTKFTIVCWPLSERVYDRRVLLLIWYV